MVHILNQYIWPDGAPTGIYAEQLGEELQGRGIEVRLVGGSGHYRAGKRKEPSVPRRNLPHKLGRRGNHLSTFGEYLAVNAAFASYISEAASEADVVIVTSAPPLSLRLHKVIRKRGAVAVYWLQDYYPELVRGMFDYPLTLRKVVSTWWDLHLAKWDYVVKAAGNLPGNAPNYLTLRNWPTLIPGPNGPRVNRTRSVLYTGNLGYGHDVELFSETCRHLSGEGYELLIHADGPGVKCLPAWIKPLPPFRDESQLLHALQSSEVHLVAADPAIRRAVFPSKIWNSLAAGARIVGVGFKGEMQEELQYVQTHPCEHNLTQWAEFVIGLVKPGSARQENSR